MRVVQYQIPQYQEIGGKNEEVIRMFKGLNSYDPLSIPSNHFTELENLDFEDYPTLTTRKGTEVVMGTGFQIIGFSVWKGLELHVITNDGVWRKFNGTTWTNILTGMNTSAVYSFTNFEGNLTGISLFACNGASGLYRYDGTVAAPFGNAPATINYITTYQNRIWGAATENTLHACALDDAANWQRFNGEQSDSFFKTIESERGEPITMLSGGLSKLVIGLRNSVRELYGALPQDFADKVVSEDTGFLYNYSNVTHNGTLYGVHNTGIYAYSGGTLPNKYEYDIVSKFGYDLTQARGAISFENDILFSINGDVLLLDKKSEVDSWTLFKGFNAVYFAEFNNELYIADSTGVIIKWKGVRDWQGVVNYKLITKVFTNQSIANKQRLYKLYIVADIQPGATMNVRLSSSIDGNDFELVNTVTGGNAGARRILVPVGKYAIENFIRLQIDGTGPIKLYEINRQFRTMPLV